MNESKVNKLNVCTLNFSLIKKKKKKKIKILLPYLLLEKGKIKNKKSLIISTIVLTQSFTNYLFQLTEDDENYKQFLVYTNEQRLDIFFFVK